MPLPIQGLCPLIQVFDMPASLAFYRDALGFSVVQQSGPGGSPGWSWLRLGSAELMLNTAYEAGSRPPAPDPARVAAHDDTTLYFGAGDLEAIYQHLRGLGLAPKPPRTAPYGMEQLYLHDPDGYGICFQRPAPRE